MNVAMTRAKKKLIVVGDSATIAEHDFYSGFLDYANSLNQYHSVWEWMEWTEKKSRNMDKLESVSRLKFIE